jgi:hypothetical protein
VIAIYGRQSILSESHSIYKLKENFRMAQTKASRIAALLLQTSEAHQHYHHFVLDGKEDPDWAKWYALYIIEHDWRQLMNQVWTFGQLSQFLMQAYEIYTSDRPSLSWIDYTAQQILAALYPEEGLTLETALVTSLVSL